MCDGAGDGEAAARGRGGHRSGEGAGRRLSDSSVDVVKLRNRAFQSAKTLCLCVSGGGRKVHVCARFAMRNHHGRRIVMVVMYDCIHRSDCDVS